MVAIASAAEMAVYAIGDKFYVLAGTMCSNGLDFFESPADAAADCLVWLLESGQVSVDEINGGKNEDC